MSDSAKSVYWRDLTAAEHFLGEYQVELAEARRLARAFPDRAAPHLIAARALAGLRRPDDALAELDRGFGLPADAAVRVQGSLSPGLVAYQAAGELLPHGDSAAARSAAERAVPWYAAGPTDFEVDTSWCRPGRSESHGWVWVWISTPTRSWL